MNARDPFVGSQLLDAAASEPFPGFGIFSRLPGIFSRGDPTPVAFPWSRRSFA